MFSFVRLVVVASQRRVLHTVDRMAVQRSSFMERRLRKIGKKWGEWENRKYTVAMDKTGDLIDAWCNDRFAVQLFENGEFLWLSIRKHAEHVNPPTWSELQRIKTELVGAEREGVQVFPRQSEIVDQANMYHVWLYPAGERCPFNFTNVGWATPVHSKTAP